MSSIKSGSDHEGGDINHYSTKHHHHFFSGVVLKVTLLFIIMGITSLLLNQSTNHMEFYQKRYFSTDNLCSSSSSTSSHDNHSDMQQDVFHQYMTQDPHFQGEKEDELGKTLRKAVMKDNKTVIITALNTAWSDPDSVFDLFLESFRIGIGTQNLLKHVVVLTLDPIAHYRCLEKNLHCYSLFINRANSSEEATFNSKDYFKMLWRRIDFLRLILQRGYDFVFTDADVMWFRDPFPRFYPDGDFQIACDDYLFNSTGLNNTANGGFVYVRSNDRTIQFYKYWYTGNYYFPKDHDQGLFNIIKFNPFVREIGLKIRFLDTDYISGFCQPSRDLDLVATMHANCCVNLWNKKHQLPMIMNDWKKYRSSPTAFRNLTCPWSIPRICANTPAYKLWRISSNVTKCKNN